MRPRTTTASSRNAFENFATSWQSEMQPGAQRRQIGRATLLMDLMGRVTTALLPFRLMQSRGAPQSPPCGKEYVKASVRGWRALDRPGQCIGSDDRVAISRMLDATRLFMGK